MTVGDSYSHRMPVVSCEHTHIVIECQLPVVNTHFEQQAHLRQVFGFILSHKYVLKQSKNIQNDPQSIPPLVVEMSMHHLNFL